MLLITYLPIELFTKYSYPIMGHTVSYTDKQGTASVLKEYREKEMQWQRYVWVSVHVQ